MLGTIVPSYTLSNAWPGSSIGPSATVRDINGVAITVGATVKLVGTVQSINADSKHFMEVTIVPNYPSGNNIPPQQGNYLPPTSPLPGKPIFRLGASQLIVGS